MRPALLALALLLSGCSSSPEPLPSGSDNFPTNTELPTPDTAQAAPTQETLQRTPTTCDVVREALLTGTQAEIDASMRALVADKTADVDARESADNYLQRDSDESRRSFASLVRMQCD